MVYLSGHVSASLPEGVGVMMTPMMGNLLPDSIPWAADTGCFAKPDAFSPEKYIAYLSRYRTESPRCLFATMPDVVGNAVATIDKIGDWPDVIRDLGYSAAFVAQNGLESLPVPWDRFDALFIGGDTAWKLGQHATTLIRAAQERGKWVHVGRVNSYRRLRHCEWQGANSVDGTFLAFGPDTNKPRLSRWLKDLIENPRLI